MRLVDATKVDFELTFDGTLAKHHFISGPHVQIHKFQLWNFILQK